MHIIVCHTPKGGSGKSTLARELAVAATTAGLRAALADLDPQGTTTGWYKRRQADAPVLVRFDPVGATTDLEAAGVELLIVDTPPAAPPFVPPLLRRASLVVVPVRPTPDDLLGAAPIARGLAGHPAWAFVLSQVPPRTRHLVGSLRQLAALGRVAPGHLSIRTDFPSAAITGNAACETDGKAADEVRAIWSYVHTMLEGARDE